MVETVHDAVKGRARYRVGGLYKSESLRKKIETGLKREAGIRQVSASALTGKVLVLFDGQREPGNVATLIETLLSTIGDGTPSAALRSIREGEIPVGPPNGTQTPPRTVKETRKLLKSAQPQNGQAWHQREAVSVIEHFGSSAEFGLSTETATTHLHKYGPNVLPDALPPSG
jgi:Ca2+-transporting ATPase